ncbi:hypothetical protein V2J09_014149, partial [Rumex salicifolius]
IWDVCGEQLPGEKSLSLINSYHCKNGRTTSRSCHSSRTQLFSDTAMMDWYNGLDTEDFVVPKDEELLDVFPTEDSWQQWGMSGSQNFGWPMKFETLKKADLPGDKAVFGKATAQESLRESGSPNGFSMTGGWPSDQWCEDTMEQDRPDFQFNDLMRNDQMDDIFLSSLLKEDPTASENNDVKSSQLCSETQLSSGSADGDSESLMFDFQSVSGAIQSRESLRDFETGHVGTSSVSNSTSMGLNDRHLGKVRLPICWIQYVLSFLALG